MKIFEDLFAPALGAVTAIVLYSLLVNPAPAPPYPPSGPAPTPAVKFISEEVDPHPETAGVCHLVSRVLFAQVDAEHVQIQVIVGARCDSGYSHLYRSRVGTAPIKDRAAGAAIIKAEADEVAAEMVAVGHDDVTAEGIIEHADAQESKEIESKNL